MRKLLCLYTNWKLSVIRYWLIDMIVIWVSNHLLLKEREILDEMDGVYKGGYRRRTFLILGEDGRIYPADLYQVIDPQNPFPPSKSYLQGMMTGAREIDLDPEYIKTIEQFFGGEHE